MGTWPLYWVWSGYRFSAWILLGVVLELLFGHSWRPGATLGRMALRSTIRLRIMAWPHRRWGLRLLGCVTVVMTAALVFVAISAALWLLGSLSVWLLRGAFVVLTFEGLAVRELSQAAIAVFHSLVRGNFDQARGQLSRWVGIESRRMGHAAMVRATVQSVAEQTTEAIGAPLLYVCLGGPALLWTYQAIHRLDLGLRSGSPRAREFGWFAAIMNRAAIFLPARITGFALCLAAGVEGRFNQAYTVMVRDGRRYYRPDGGLSEAAMAGALGIRLGGVQRFAGVVALAPPIGDEEFRLEPLAILQAVVMMLRAVTIIAVSAGLIAFWFTGQWLA